MQFTVDQSVLQKALGVVDGAITKTTTLPILSHVLIEALEEDEVKLMTTNLAMAIICRIPAKVAINGSLAVPVGLVRDYVSQLSSIPDLTLTSDIATFKLTITQGRNEAHFSGMDPEDFPLCTKLGFEIATFTAKDLRTAVGKVKHAVGKEADKLGGALTNIALDFDGERVTFVAVDSFRLASYVIKSDGIPGQKRLLLNAKNLNEMVKSLPNDDTPVDLHKSTREERVWFLCGNMSFEFQLEGSVFPSWREIIPKGPLTYLYTSGTEEFNQAVYVVSRFAHDSRIQLSHLYLGAEGSRLFYELPEAGECEAKLEGTFIGEEEQEYKINLTYLKDALAPIESGQIEFGFRNHTSPCIIRPKGDANFLQLIMPMTH